MAAMATAIALIAGCSRVPDGPATRELAPATSAKLDAAITGAIKDSKAPGVMVGVWSPQGDYVRAFGVADPSTGTPRKTGFHSRIGSGTKTFTATAVLQLVDKGVIGLDDPIARYVDGVPGGQSITVRQLATMRSGLPDYLDNDDFGKNLIADPTREFTPGELLDFAFAKPAVFPPGERYQYSNTNYIRLGLLVEKVAGSSLSHYLTEHVLKPLGLSHTLLPTGTQFPDPHATGYTDPPEPGGAPVDATGWNASFTWAAGAMISTLEDMRVWVPACATGTLISPELQRQRLLSPPAEGLPPGVGYGMGVFTVSGWIGHNGSLPGYQTVAVYLPERTMTVVAMINTDITSPGGPQPSTAVVKAITSVLTPDHVYDV